MLGLPRHALLLIAGGILDTLALKVLEQGGPELLEIVEGHREAARGGGLVDVDADDAAAAEDSLDLVVGGEGVEGGGAALEDGPRAVEAHDARRALEGVEHDGHAPVLVQVADGLVAGPRQVMVPEGVLVRHPEALAALGRHVDVAPGRERRRCDPEHLLRPDPRDHRVGDGFVEDAHDVSFLSGNEHLQVLDSYG